MRWHPFAFSFTTALCVMFCSSAQATDTNVRYIVTFEMRQVHFTLDPLEYAKDALNATTFEIPVDPKYFDSIKEGDTVKSSFRKGSLLVRGNYGNWAVTVKKKEKLSYSAIPR
jgi:hypothetical protein